MGNRPGEQRTWEAKDLGGKDQEPFPESIDDIAECDK